MEVGRMIEKLRDRAMVGRMEVRDKQLMLEVADRLEELEKEIARLNGILEAYALQYGTVVDQQKVIDQAKAEVVREIFEEIEHEMFMCDPDYGRLYHKFNELKKEIHGGTEQWLNSRKASNGGYGKTTEKRWP